MTQPIAALTANARLVLLYLRDHPGSTGNDICAQLAIAPTELRDALAQLEQHGVLVATAA